MNLWEYIVVFILISLAFFYQFSYDLLWNEMCKCWMKSLPERNFWRAETLPLLCHPPAALSMANLLLWWKMNPMMSWLLVGLNWWIYWLRCCPATQSRDSDGGKIQLATPIKDDEEGHLIYKVGDVINARCINLVILSITLELLVPTKFAPKISVLAQLSLFLACLHI